MKNTTEKNTKTCSRCQTEQPITNFAIHGLGRQSHCRDCYRIYNSEHILDTTYNNIIGRCNNPDHPSYNHYGARGVKCEFRNKYEFIGYILRELGPRPEGHQLDRIDNSGNYAPNNLRWCTRQQNLNNRTNTLRLSDGTPVSEYYHSQPTKSPVSYNTFSTRIKNGWDEQSAYILPPGQKRNVANIFVALCGQHGEVVVETLETTPTTTPTTNIQQWFTK